MMDHTVLLVEDNPDDVALTLLAFKEIRFPYKVDVARDGVEALDYLFGRGKYADKKPATPFLVLLDLNLPKIDGFEVLKKIRSDPWLKYLFVAILSSSDEEQDRTHATGLGAHIFLRKAIDYDDFIKVAKKIEGLVAAAV
jgi:two-component system, response regulator